MTLSRRAQPRTPCERFDPSHPPHSLRPARQGCQFDDDGDDEASMLISQARARLARATIATRAE